MNREIGLLILMLILAVSCPGPRPVTPTDHPGGEHEPYSFCIDFEIASNDSAIDGANAALLYRDLGVTFPSNPQIINNGALCGGSGPVPGPIRNQCLIQGDPDSPRPERSCGPLEIRIDAGLQAGKVEFEARNVGFISIPVEIVATAFGERDGVEVLVDKVRILSRSEFGDLRPVELVTLRSEASEPAITRVVVEYGSCPPHIVINDLCIEPKERTIGTIGQSDSGADRLVYYFDNRDRHSYIQLANLANSEVDVHVQIWIANSSFAECEEIDFVDTYTALDVHTYDTLDIVTNSGRPIGFTPGPLAGKYGFIVISKSEGSPNPLVGTMTILDNAGYEYKTNAVAPESAITSTNKYGAVNFNNINGNSFSEIIGFTYTVLSEDTVYASSGITTVFGSPSGSLLVFDANENLTSCSAATFSCSHGNTNVALDNSLPSPHDPGSRICPAIFINASNNSGWMQLPFSGTVCTDPFAGDSDGNCRFDTYFVGFFGLTNGTNSGVFDSWWGGKTIDAE